MDKKISELDSLASVKPADTLVVVDSATNITKKASVAGIKSALGVLDKFAGPTQDGKVVVYDGVTGDKIKDTPVTISNIGAVTGVSHLTAEKAMIRYELKLDHWADSLSTGAKVLLPDPNSVIMSLTNTSLVSVAGMDDSNLNELRIIRNDTGKEITVLHNEPTIADASKRIYLPEGTNLKVPHNAAFFLVNIDGRFTVMGVTAAPAAASAQVEVDYITLTAADITNKYVDLTRLAVKIMDVSAKGYPSQWPGDDFTTSTVSGKTRITFVGDMLSLVEGDKVKVVYSY